MTISTEDRLITDIASLLCLTIEVDGSEKPAVVAEQLIRVYQ